MMYILTRLLYATLRVKVSTESVKCFSRAGASILIVWHNRISIMPYIQGTYRGAYPIYGLVSPSKDGAILERFFKFFGIRTVRGSSNRNGAKAAVSLIRELRKGYDICITPDGPKGPKYEMKSGAMVVCDKSGARLLFIRVKFGKSWVFNTWDNFVIPKPFSSLIFEADEVSSFSELQKLAVENSMSVEAYSERLLNGAC